MAVTQDKAQETQATEGLLQDNTAPNDISGRVRDHADQAGIAQDNPAPEDAPASLPDDPAVADLPPSDSDAALSQADLAVTPQTAPPRRSALVPMVLGGAVAAALGFGAASYLQSGSLWPAGDSALSDRVAEQELALAALNARLDAAPAAPDVTPLSREIADLRADIVAATEALRPEIDALAARIDALETNPAVGAGAVGSAALTALQEEWQTQVDALKSALGAQEMRLDAVATEANARLDEARSEIAGISAAATDAATAIARRGALSRVLAALDAGTPFDEALAEVAGDSAPQMLANLAESGVPTLAQLQARFPEAARAALATARAENLSGEAGGFTGFLRRQFDVRSTAERAGDDPDAILSRAEARLAEFDLDAALAEIATLPEVVRAALGDWLTLADTRKAALAEADALAASLTDN